MRKLPAIALTVGLGLGMLSAGSAVVSWSETKRLHLQLRQSDELFRKLQAETSGLETEKAKLARDYETLQRDVVSYVSVNTKLQEDNKELKASLEEAQARVEEQTQELEKLQDKLERLHKEMARAKTDQRKAVTKEFKDLAAKVATLEDTLKHERALYRYNLGIVYAQAQRYDEAIEAYQNSLELEANNADAHYNLGLLYERVKSQSDRAAWHYRRYLELKPKAEDRDEVQQRIDMLTAALR
ncbi:MAG: tetratricopeptide repeat protein [Candidatus Omnitrophica bacterium]|nr:tetratricopeptide repeat protein [Candidatus Omnitrophota bacterium]